MKNDRQYRYKGKESEMSKGKFQYGMVGVGYSGIKGHFVRADVGSKVRFDKEEVVYFNAYVGCGSQRFSQNGMSGISGFVPFGEAFEVESDEYFEWWVKAGSAAKVAFEAAKEKFGGNFCQKCFKEAERFVGYCEQQIAAQVA